MELDVGERDVDIEETARVRLQHSPYHAVRLVNCTFQNGVLKLTGHVPTFHYKQLAQTTIADLRGVIQVVNDIHVQ
jgi:osmotically-inducible protein OsmY